MKKKMIFDFCSIIFQKLSLKILYVLYKTEFTSLSPCTQNDMPMNSVSTRGLCFTISADNRAIKPGYVVCLIPFGPSDPLLSFQSQ